MRKFPKQLGSKGPLYYGFELYSSPRLKIQESLHTASRCRNHPHFQPPRPPNVGILTYSRNRYIRLLNAGILHPAPQASTYRNPYTQLPRPLAIATYSFQMQESLHTAPRVSRNRNRYKQLPRPPNARIPIYSTRGIQM